MDEQDTWTGPGITVTWRNQYAELRVDVSHVDGLAWLTAEQGRELARWLEQRPSAS